MKLTRIEKAVIESLLTYKKGFFAKEKPDFTKVKAFERTCSDSGFMTELERSDELKLAGPVEAPFGDVKARLNVPPVNTGYLFFVEDGYLCAVEGFLYDVQSWPDEITTFELYY